MAVVQSTLNGLQVTDARVSIPGWGLSYADVTLAGEHTVKGAATLVVADLTLKCTILSGGPAVGRSFFRAVVGAGGWGTSIPKRSYTNDAGVKLLTVLKDAATACGETLDATTVDPAATVGTYYVRRVDLACRVLEQLSPGAWYVGEDGVTRLGARPTTKPSTALPVTSQVDLAQARVKVMSDSIAQLLPGVVFEGVTAVDVEHEVSSKGGLHTTLWGKIGAGASRRLAALRALFDQLDPGRAYRGMYEYRVVTQSGERLNLQAVRVSTGMPDVQAVLPRPGILGVKGQPALGSRVLVAFVNADPTNPVVLAYENAEASGFLPTFLQIDSNGTIALGPSATGVVVAGGGPAAGRVGDEITITAGQFAAAVPIANLGTGAVTISNPMKGTISKGSTKVTCG
jgi:hypothetical protein